MYPIVSLGFIPCSVNTITHGFSLMARLDSACLVELRVKGWQLSIATFNQL